MGKPKQNQKEISNYQQMQNQKLPLKQQICKGRRQCKNLPKKQKKIQKPNKSKNNKHFTKKIKLPNRNTQNQQDAYKPQKEPIFHSQQQQPQQLNKQISKKQNKRRQSSNRHQSQNNIQENQVMINEEQAQNNSQQKKMMEKVNQKQILEQIKSLKEDCNVFIGRVDRLHKIICYKASKSSGQVLKKKLRKRASQVKRDYVCQFKKRGQCTKEYGSFSALRYHILDSHFQNSTDTVQITRDKINKNVAIIRINNRIMNFD